MTHPPPFYLLKPSKEPHRTCTQRFHMSTGLRHRMEGIPTHKSQRNKRHSFTGEFLANLNPQSYPKSSICRDNAFREC